MRRIELTTKLNARWTGALLLLFAAVTCPTLGSTASPSAIVLITVANLRSDCAEICETGSVAQNAFADFSASAVDFKNATAASAWQNNNLWGIMTSRISFSAKGPVGPALKATTLAELLAGLGYRTAVFSDGESPVGFPELGRGFQEKHTMPGERFSAVSAAAIDWIHQSTTPAFIWIHSTDLEQSAAAHDRREYCAAYRRFDQSLGTSLRELRSKAEIKALVLTGDRGAALQKTELTRGMKPYDHWIHIPLLVFPSRADKGAPVSHLDIAPTLMAVAGLEHINSFEGHPLTDDSPRRDSTFFGSSPRNETPPLYGLRSERWSIIEGENGFEVYDLLKDPGQQHNQVKKNPQQALTLSQKLMQRTAAVAPATSAVRERLNMTPELLERLREVGYWGKESAPRNSSESGPLDSASFVGALREILIDDHFDVRDASRTLEKKGLDPQTTAQILAQALQHPEPMIRRDAASMLVRIGQYAEPARAALDQAAQKDSDPVVRDFARQALDNMKPRRQSH